MTGGAGAGPSPSPADGGAGCKNSSRSLAAVCATQTPLRRVVLPPGQICSKRSQTDSKNASIKALADTVPRPPWAARAMPQGGESTTNGCHLVFTDALIDANLRRQVGRWVLNLGPRFGTQVRFSSTHRLGTQVRPPRVCLGTHPGSAPRLAPRFAKPGSAPIVAPRMWPSLKSRYLYPLRV